LPQDTSGDDAASASKPDAGFLSVRAACSGEDVAKEMDIEGALKSWEFVQVFFKKKEKRKQQQVVKESIVSTTASPQEPPPRISKMYGLH
jgi:hypothetical protein